MVRPLSTDKQSSHYDDLVRTVTYLEKLREARPIFATSLAAWCLHRKRTIETVEDLHRKIEALHVGCNVGRGAGAAAGIVGILAGIVGLVLESKGHDAAKDVQKVGSYCAGGGLVTVAASTLLEVGLSQSAINEIKKVLEKDIELTEPLKPSIKFSRELEYLVHRLFQCNIASATFFNVIKVCRHCIELLNNGQYELSVLLQSLQNNKLEGFEDISLEVVQKVYHFLKGIRRNPRLIQPAGEICRLFRETPHTFEFARLGCQLYSRAYEVLNIQPLSLILSAANICDSGPFSSSNSVLVRHAFDTISIGFYVVSIILAVKNIKESKSQYSEALDRVKFALRTELTQVTQQMNAPVVRALSVDYDDDHERLDL